LLEAVHALNNGTDLTGNELSGKPQLFAGAVANPGASDPDMEIDNLHRKIDAGAQFFQTQAVYDVQAYAAFLDKARSPRPMLAGIIPIKSVKMATYMNERIPGVDIPDALIQQIADAGDDKNQIARVSVEIAAKTIRELRSVSPGVHLMAIGWESYIPQILAQSQP